MFGFKSAPYSKIPLSLSALKTAANTFSVTF